MQEVIHAAYNAFYAGLHAALLVAAILVLLAGVFTFVMLSRGPRPPAPASHMTLASRPPHDPQPTGSRMTPANGKIHPFQP